MKKQVLSLITLAIISAFTWQTASAQAYHFKEGFGVDPAGWVFSNTFLTGSASNVHNEYEGTKSVKMKGVESSFETTDFATAKEFSYWVMPKVESATVKIEKSVNAGTTWTELETYTATIADLGVYQKRTIAVDDKAETVRIKITCAGGADSDGIFYIDDLSLTKMEAPADDPTLAEIAINGTAISDFSGEKDIYTFEMYYTNEVAVSAVSNNPDAKIEITQPSNIFGGESQRKATLLVTSKDETATKTYTVLVNVTEFLHKTGFIITGESMVQEPGWTSLFSYTSTSIPGPGNKGDYVGDAAYKFIRGQADKQGILQSPNYANIKTLSFSLFIEAADPSAKINIITKTGFAAEKTIATINAADLKGDEWTKFTYDIDQTDSTYIKFSPTLPTDGETRIWMDDLAITSAAYNPTSIRAEKTNRVKVNTYPNPVQNILVIDSDKAFNKATIYNVSGQIVKQLSLNGGNTINVENLRQGTYILELESKSVKSVSLILKQ